MEKENQETVGQETLSRSSRRQLIRLKYQNNKKEQGTLRIIVHYKLRDTLCRGHCTLLKEKLSVTAS